LIVILGCSSLEILEVSRCLYYIENILECQEVLRKYF